ncbi:hypothetical protein ACFVT2_43045 [Streptomyces sp. NPDC058000]|uniref:hypothetical protein n=1 Tax=Streptomyces sp. NPDC058000 TaxID=3346299 RepID=UPI0036EC3E68
MDSSAIVRDLFAYSHHHPDEQPKLHQLFEVMRSHRTQGRCIHADMCPEVVVGAIVMNESRNVLCGWHDDRWAFVEGTLVADDTSLLTASVRVLMETTGWFHVWPEGEDQSPLHIDVQESSSGSLRFGFRYLVCANTSDAEITPNGIAFSWRPVSSVGQPALRTAIEARTSSAT